MSETTCGRCHVPTSGTQLCDDHQRTFRWAIVNVAIHYTDLDTLAQRQARYSNGSVTKGSIGKAQPLVVDMRFVSASSGAAKLAPGSQLRDDAWNTVHGWTRSIMEEQPERHGPTCDEPCAHASCATVYRSRWPRNTIGSMTNYLARQFPYLIREQWAPQMLDEFLYIEGRLKRMIDRPADRWYAGQCGVTDNDGTCDTELYAREDRGWIDCPGCGIQHDVAERRDFLLNEAADQLTTATEAASALIAWTDYDGSPAKLGDLIRKWCERGRLASHGHREVNGRDRQVYRFGDVWTLMLEHAQKDRLRKMTA